MLDFINSYFNERTGTEVARDLFDIFIVYFIFYRLLLVARGTRAIQIAAGLGIVSLFYVFAQIFELVTIVTLVGALLQSIILVIVVVFQNDIRRALQRVGSRAIFGGARAQENQVIEHVVQAARELARHRIGALITFELDANLDEFIGQNKGIELDAKVSAELLVSLFVPEGSNKLHDGALILRNLRIAKAGVFFPMPENRSFDSQFGSRHRAALGITEETDAVVVVVSEERGTIGFCYNGNIATDLQANQLRDMLHSILNPKQLRKSLAQEKAVHERQSLLPTPPPSPEEMPPPSVRAASLHPGAARGDTLRASSVPATTTSTAGSSLPQEAPRPLRKSSLPDEPTTAADSSSDSIQLPIATPRPMPKAAELERPHEPDESDDGPRTPS